MDRPLMAAEAAHELGYNIHRLCKLLRKGIVKGERFNQLWMIDRQEVDRIKSLQGTVGDCPSLPRTLGHSASARKLGEQRYNAVDTGEFMPVIHPPAEQGGMMDSLVHTPDTLLRDADAVCNCRLDKPLALWYNRIIE